MKIEKRALRFVALFAFKSLSSHGRVCNSAIQLQCTMQYAHNMVIVILQTLYDPSFIAVYNVIYTSLPIVALAVLDQVRQ